MRMNPPRGMGGMGPQVSNGSVTGTQNQAQRTMLIKLSQCMASFSSARVLRPRCAAATQTDLVLGAVIFLNKANFWLPFVKSVHKNSRNVKPTGYKLHANTLSPFLKRSFLWLHQPHNCAFKCHKRLDE